MTSDRFSTALTVAAFLLAAGLGLFIGGLWAGLGIGLAILLYITTTYVDKKPPQLPQAWALLALATLAAFYAETPFSSDPTLSNHVAFKLATIFLPLLALTAPRLRPTALPDFFFPALAATMATAAVALFAELRSGGVLLHLIGRANAHMTDYNRGLAHGVIMAFPILAALWVGGRKKAVWALALILLFPASLTDSRTAKLALLAGSAATLVAAYAPTLMRRALAALSVLILGFPFYAQAAFTHILPLVDKLPTSWRHRVEIWDYLSYRIAEHPWFGWGLGTTHLLDNTQPHGNLYIYATVHAPHAHNFVTELWVEAGLPGLAAGLGFMLLTLRAASRLPPKLIPFAYGSWLAAFCVAMFGFDFWTDALWASFALSGFAFALAAQSVERSQNAADA